MRKRLVWLAAGLLLAAGCGKSDPVYVPEDENTAQQRQKEQAEEELKERRQREKAEALRKKLQKGKKARPDEDE